MLFVGCPRTSPPARRRLPVHVTHHPALRVREEAARTPPGVAWCRRASPKASSAFLRTADSARARSRAASRATGAASLCVVAYAVSDSVERARARPGISVARGAVHAAQAAARIAHALGSIPGTALRRFRTASSTGSSRGSGRQPMAARSRRPRGERGLVLGLTQRRCFSPSRTGPRPRTVAGSRWWRAASGPQTVTWYARAQPTEKPVRVDLNRVQSKGCARFASGRQRPGASHYTQGRRSLPRTLRHPIWLS
jgi:hypothetical protein